jgi:hypothetical protein
VRKRLAFRPGVEALEPRWTPSVSFDSRQTVTSADADAASADFNGDGKPDLALAHSGDRFFSGPSVSVLLNTTPTGATRSSFGPAQSFAVGPSVGMFSVHVTVGDFNGDGKPDLAVKVSGQVGILLNTTPAGSSTVTFAALQTFTAGAGADGPLAVADFNGDGKADLATTSSSGNTVSVLLNTTAAGSNTLSFTAAQTFAVGTNPVALAAADFNGDGKPDLAVTNTGSNTVSVLLNTTAAGSDTASFAAQTTFAVGSHPAGVLAADFNADGRPDLAVANSSDQTVSVLLNTTASGAATPSFAAQQTFAAGGSALVAADFNGDGRPDLATSGGPGISISVLVNTTPAMATTASFAPAQTFGVPSGVLVVADFNGDGRPDLYSDEAIFIGSQATVLLNTSVSAVVGQFGVDGVWQYNNATGAWIHLTAANASRLAADSWGDVVGTFPGQGVWLFTPAAGWKLINGVDAGVLTMDVYGDVVANFPGFGVGQFVPGVGWSLLTGAQASLLAVDAQGDIAGEFQGLGVWLFQPSAGWKQINGVDASLLGMDAQGDVVANFPVAGLSERSASSGGWTVLNGQQASALAVDFDGRVAAQFAGFGVGLFVPGTGWTLLTAANASQLATDDGFVVGGFGGQGVWEFDPVRGWIKLTDANASLLAMV